MRINFEQKLVEQCKRLEASALDSLFRTYEKPIFSLVYRILGIQGQNEIEDITQDIFIKIMKALPNFRSEANMTTWIYRITINHCSNMKRKWYNHHREKMLSLENEKKENPVTFEKIMGDISGDPMKATIRAELQSVINDGLAEITPDFRTIIILRDIEGLSYDEIAETLAISIGTVKSRLSRARLRLRKKIHHYL